MKAERKKRVEISPLKLSKNKHQRTHLHAKTKVCLVFIQTARKKKGFAEEKR